MYLKSTLAAVSAMLLMSVLRSRYYIKSLKESSSEGKIIIYRSWLISSFLLFGGFGTFIIYYLNMLNPHANREGRSTIYHPYDLAFHLVRTYINVDHSQLYPSLFGFFIGIIAIFLIARTRRGRNFYNTDTLLVLRPSSTTETLYLLLLCINAGVSEEIMFRGALPSLLLAITHNETASLTVSCLVFGSVHWYQGARGVISTFLMAIFFSAILIAGFEFYIVMLLHFLFNVAALFLIPRAYTVDRPDTSI